jgi:tetratricopeptide (TPR) repeat protein
MNQAGLRSSFMIGMLAMLAAGCVPMHQDLALTALQDGRLNDAVQEVQLALAQSPDDPQVKKLAASIYTNRAARFYYAGNMTAAQADLERARSYDPDYPATWEYLGLVAFSAHNWKDAIADGERAAALAGRPPAAYVATARTQLEGAQRTSNR